MHPQIKSRVFITGASGFIGANIVRFLIENNYEVHILNRSKKISWRIKDIAALVTVHHGDLTEYNSLKKALQNTQPDYIIHLAAYGAYHYQTDLGKMVKVNIEGTKNLLEASLHINYKCFINTGSSSEYGLKQTAMKEDDFCDPVSYYAAAKLAQTHICKLFAMQNNKPIITLRLFSVFGPYEEPTRFIPTIMTSLIKKTQIKLTPGKQRRDFIYVDDVVKAYIKGMELNIDIPGQVFNIGSGVEMSNDEIVNDLFKVSNMKTKVLKGAYPKRAWDTKHWVADISKSKKLLHWQPDHSTSDGLRDTFDWFNKNINLYSV